MSAKTGNGAVGAGVLLIALAVFAFDETVPFSGVYALAATLGAPLLIRAATLQTIIGRALGSRTLVGVGLVS